jgi:uncharacterized RDD family membrane protein YckC
MTISTNPLHRAAHPSLGRVLAAIFYDAWLIVALMLLGATLDTFIRHAFIGSSSEGSHAVLQLYLVLIPLIFFSGFWVYGGQTLGMRAWRIRVLTTQGEPLTTRQAILRYCCAGLSWLALGLGYIWILIDPDNRSWHDRLSSTCLVLVQKNQKS